MRRSKRCSQCIWSCAMPRYHLAPELTDEYISTVWINLPRHLRPTLLLPREALSAQLGCDLTVASETFQFPGSFQFRAASHFLSSLPQHPVVAAPSRRL